MIDKVKLAPLNIILVSVAVEGGAVIFGDVPQLMGLKPQHNKITEFFQIFSLFYEIIKKGKGYHSGVNHSTSPL